MAGKLDWNGDAYSRAVENATSRRLAAVGEILVDVVRDNIDTPAPPHSHPGEYPHKDTGRLYESVRSTHSRRELRTRVEARTPYAEHVEEIRPYLRRTVQENRKWIVDTLTDDLDKGGGFNFRG